MTKHDHAELTAKIDALLADIAAGRVDLDDARARMLGLKLEAAQARHRANDLTARVLGR
jgi:hypothetical protein